MEYTKKELKNTLKYQIANSDNKAIHALMTIYSYQTDEEKHKIMTIEHNGIGFSSVDSTILSSFAEQFHRNGKLSNKQMTLLKKIMPRYAGQLLKLSFANGNFEKVGKKWKIKR